MESATKTPSHPAAEETKPAGEPVTDDNRVTYILNESFVKRFKELTKRVDHPDACWPWQGPLHRQGFGRLKTGGEDYGAHRVAWELDNGPIPKDHIVLHVCNNRGCVRPDHLICEKGRHKRGSKTMKHGFRSNELLLNDVMPSMFHVKQHELEPGVKVVMGGEGGGPEVVSLLKSVGQGVHALLTGQQSAKKALGDAASHLERLNGHVQTIRDNYSGLRQDLQRATARMGDLADAIQRSHPVVDLPAPEESGPQVVPPPVSAVVAPVPDPKPDPAPEVSLGETLARIFASHLNVPAEGLDAQPLLDTYDLAITKEGSAQAKHCLRSWLESFAVVVGRDESPATPLAFFAWVVTYAS